MLFGEALHVNCVSLSGCLWALGSAPGPLAASCIPLSILRVWHLQKHPDVFSESEIKRDFLSLAICSIRETVQVGKVLGQPTAATQTWKCFCSCSERELGWSSETKLEAKFPILGWTKMKNPTRSSCWGIVEKSYKHFACVESSIRLQCMLRCARSCSCPRSLWHLQDQPYSS